MTNNIGYVPDSVKAIGSMNLEGNVIPHEWFKHIKFENGRVDMNAIVILSEIVYWHRPTVVKDEGSGAVRGIKKKFKADLLQRSYDSFSEQFGLSKRQSTDAIKRLEELGLVKRHLRHITVGGLLVSNVLFIELIHEKVRSITTPSHVTTWDPVQHNVTPINTERQSNTETTTENTTESKKISLIMSDDENVLYYNQLFQQYRQNDHFWLTKEQMKEVDDVLSQMRNAYNIEDEPMKNIMLRHFEEYGHTHSGSIMHFISNNGGVILRYARELGYK